MKKIRNYLFRNFLDEDEVILDLAHSHIIILKYALLKPLFFGIAIPVIIYFAFPIPQIALVAIIWGLVGLYGIILKVIDWYYDVWIMTNSGVIAVHRNGYFDISTQRIDYHLIDDISYQIKGFAAMMLDFGDITIDKMVASVSVVLKDAPHPKKLERKITQYKERFVSDKTIRDHDELKTLLADMISAHVHKK